VTDGSGKKRGKTGHGNHTGFKDSADNGDTSVIKRMERSEKAGSFFPSPPGNQKRREEGTDGTRKEQQRIELVSSWTNKKVQPENEKQDGSESESGMVTSTRVVKQQQE
jgi:hypothetical protein